MTVFICVPLPLDLGKLKVFQKLKDARAYEANTKGKFQIIKRVVKEPEHWY